MSKHQVVVVKIVAEQLAVAEAAQEHGISRRQLHRLLARYRQGGLDAVEPRSRRPRTNPTATSDPIRERIIQLRRELTAQGLDAGPVTIVWHLEQESLRAPSTSTIRRILHSASLITPEPRKRPKSSYLRFEAAQPNETWQSDFTHWHLADGTDIEFLNWLDDHSRYLLSCTAYRPVTGDDVVTTFLAVTDSHGIPASTLTDNGRVYTARFGGGRNAFEYLLPLLGTCQKNGSPGHPQTQGKIERFHQTLKRWLGARPAATTIQDLQHQLDQFRNHYNEHRPHRSNNRVTPRRHLPRQPESPPRRTQRGPLPAPLSEVSTPGVDVYRYVNTHEDPSSVSLAVAFPAFQAVQGISIPLGLDATDPWVNAAAARLLFAATQPTPQPKTTLERMRRGVPSMLSVEAEKLEDEVAESLPTRIREQFSTGFDPKIHMADPRLFPLKLVELAQLVKNPGAVHTALDAAPWRPT